MAKLVFIAQGALLHGDKHTGPCVLAFEIWYLPVTHSIFLYNLWCWAWDLVKCISQIPLLAAFFVSFCWWETAERLDTDRRRRNRLSNVSLLFISSESFRWLQAPWLPPAVECQNLWQAVDRSYCSPFPDRCWTLLIIKALARVISFRSNLSKALRPPNFNTSWNRFLCVQSWKPLSLPIWMSFPVSPAGAPVPFHAANYSLGCCSGLLLFFQSLKLCITTSPVGGVFLPGHQSQGAYIHYKCLVNSSGLLLTGACNLNSAFLLIYVLRYISWLYLSFSMSCSTLLHWLHSSSSQHSPAFGCPTNASCLATGLSILY